MYFIVNQLVRSCILLHIPPAPAQGDGQLNEEYPFIFFHRGLVLVDLKSLFFLPANGLAL